MNIQTINANNQGGFETPRTRRTKLKFEVKINNTDMISRVAKWESKEQLRIVGRASNAETVPEGLMERYMKTLLYLRVAIVNDVRLDRDYKTVVGKLYVPARWYTMLDNIGVAYDNKRNLEFYPNYDLVAADMLTADEMKSISETLAFMKAEGYVVIRGVPYHEEGTIEFMAKIALAEGNALDTIRGMDPHNPVFGFFANMFQLELIGITYKEIEYMYRVEYSSGDVYDLQFVDYYRSVNSNEQPAEIDTEYVKET